MPEKKKLGEIQVFYASQTGTAAKMAGNFAEEAAEHGFEGIVLSLKDISHAQFKVYTFLLSQTKSQYSSWQTQARANPQRTPSYS